jgi:hypothetical protein
MSDDLAAWLLEQIAQDERENSAADEPPDWCDRSAGAHYEYDRILAECEAKRGIVEACRPYAVRYFSTDGEAVAWGVLTTLTLPYVDRPGYRQEWALT